VQRSANGSGTYAWDDLHRWWQGAHTILFFHTDRMFFVVPRRSLSDEQRCDLIDTVAASKMPVY
jgi:hypothetical protein